MNPEHGTMDMDDRPAERGALSVTERVASRRAELLALQNLPRGLAAGAAAGLTGAIIWAAITALTGYQIGFMAVGIGLLVGYAVRYLGNGITPVFGVVGAACALLACIVGNLFYICYVASNIESIPLTRAVELVLTHPAAALELLGETFHPMDVLFYGIAVYEGYRFSFRKVDWVAEAHEAV